MKDYRIEPPVVAETPACPRCGSTFYEDVYKADCGVVIGCDECVWRVPAEEWWDEIAEELEEERWEWQSGE